MRVKSKMISIATITISSMLICILPFGNNKKENIPIEKYDTDEEISIETQTKEENTDNSIKEIEIVQDETINESSSIEQLEKEDVGISEKDTNVIEDDYILEDVSYYNGSFKAYMPYTAITNKTSKQYELQQYAKNSPEGIRMVEDRYCIALGTGFGISAGDHVDVIMENGNIVKCIVGDIKADIHTDPTNKYHTSNGSFLEFIVDIDAISTKVKTSGNVSNANDILLGNVSQLKIYKTN